MENALKSWLQSVRLGEVQVHKSLAIVPLLCPEEGRFKYLALSEALATWNVAVTEVSAGGSMSELLVVNRGDTPVLLIDGEELAGAKKNRALNTSILLKESSETKLPVSCTERGRWSYNSRTFSESGYVMPRTLRARKACSVSAALGASTSFLSDQGEVWDGIAQLQSKARTPSPTSAMSDVFKAVEEDLLECERVLQPMPSQVGLLAVIDGKAAGLDLLSLSAAYAKLHPKLIRSYVLESLLDPKARPINRKSVSDRAKNFIDNIQAAPAMPFPSVGYGADLRFRAKGLTGTALVHNREVIHAAFFGLDGKNELGKATPRSTYSRRLAA